MRQMWKRAQVGPLNTTDAPLVRRVSSLRRTLQLMCQLHIQKTGGTDLNRWLVDAFCPCTIDWEARSFLDTRKKPGKKLLGSKLLGTCSCPHLDAMGTTSRQRGDLEHVGYTRTTKHCAAVARAKGWSPAAIMTIRARCRIEGMVLELKG